MIPTLSGENGFHVLQQMIRERSILTGLSAMRAALGNIFRITLPGFKPVFLAGPDVNRHILVTHRHDFLWRTETDPVTHLLRHGVLVTDGEEHDTLRAHMDPFFQRGHSNQHIPAFWRATRQISSAWQDGKRYDMLVEMRKVALLILMDTLFGVNMIPDLERMWKPILRSIAYISPGPWLLVKNAPRWGFSRPLNELDDYLYGLIQTRREFLASSKTTSSVIPSGARNPYNDSDKMRDPGISPVGRIDTQAPDLLTHLIQVGLDDDTVRDQLLTMLIAGHDTSTALLSWVLYLLGKYPDALSRATTEARALPPGIPNPADLYRLEYLDMVIKETLRLYPPIHVGNRKTNKDTEIQSCPVPKDTRVMVSIYLSHRDPAHWKDPDDFIPERFARENRESPPPLTYIPFGGGPRNCIGAAFSQIEAKIVLAYILQTFDLELLPRRVHPHMGATLEPRPGVWMKIRRTSGDNYL